MGCRFANLYFQLDSKIYYVSVVLFSETSSNWNLPFLFSKLLIVVPMNSRKRHDSLDGKWTSTVFFSLLKFVQVEVRLCAIST